MKKSDIKEIIDYHPGKVLYFVGGVVMLLITITGIIIGVKLHTTLGGIGATIYVSSHYFTGNYHMQPGLGYDNTYDDKDMIYTRIGQVIGVLIMIAAFILYLND